VTPLAHYTGIVGSTGEVIDVVAPAVRGRHTRKGRRKVFAMVDLESLDRLQLTGSEWRVLHRIMRAVNPETNEARVVLTEIADEMGVKNPSVYRTMRELRERRIVVTRRQGVHKVNPHIMYRGSNADWDIATEYEPEPIWRKP
jgi:predicted transcriptional regulator